MNKYVKNYLDTLDKHAQLSPGIGGAFMPGMSQTRLNNTPAANAANGGGQDLLGNLNAGAEDFFSGAKAVGQNMLTGIGNIGRSIVGQPSKPMDAPFTPVREQVRSEALKSQSDLVDGTAAMKSKGLPTESFGQNPVFKKLVTQASGNAVIQPPTLGGNTAQQNVASMQNLGGQGAQRTLDVAQGKIPTSPVNVEKPGGPGIALGGGVTPEMIQKFQKETGTRYNPKSVMDHYNMRQLMSNQKTVSAKQYKGLGSPKVKAPTAVV